MKSLNALDTMRSDRHPVDVANTASDRYGVLIRQLHLVMQVQQVFESVPQNPKRIMCLEYAARRSHQRGSGYSPESLRLLEAFPS